MTGNYLNLQNPNRAANFVKSSLFKWFQLFERTLSSERINLQMDLLAEDVRIITSLGSIIGKKSFPDRLAIFDNWILANHVSDMDIYPSGVRLYTAKTTSSYQVIHPDGKTKNYSTQFDADIKLNDDLTCVFQRIVIKTNEKNTGHFTDIYHQHRASDLIHYCMGIIEKNVKDTSLFEDCFEEEFEIQPLRNETINSTDEISPWIQSIHDYWHNLSLNPVNIEVKADKEDKEDKIHIKFDLLMEGENEHGEDLSSLSKNEWVVSNDINESFARVKQIKVEKLDPIFI